MAESLWCEPDRAKWVGVRPGFYGDRIIDSVTANNSTQTLYTVPTGHTFLLYSIACQLTTEGTGTGFVKVVDSLSSTIYQFIRTRTGDIAVTYQTAMAGSPLMELVNGDYISVYSEDAAIYTYCSIFGYEIDNTLMGN